MVYPQSRGNFLSVTNTIQGDVPLPRDDHSLCTRNDNSVIIFGGFVNGARVNDLYELKNIAPG